MTIFSFRPDRLQPHINSRSLPDFNRKLAKFHPHLLVNLTNDAWFGASSGPYQHLEATRFRALEYGLPMVRVANTGLSAVIDPYGRTIVSSRLNEKTAIDSSLPAKLAKGTIFS